MIFKKFLSLIICFLTIISMAACQNESTSDIPDKTITSTITEKTTETTSINSQSTSLDLQTTNPSLSVDSKETATSVSSIAPADDPAMWTKAEIVRIYKEAAKKSSSSVKSEQAVNLSDISINNGQFEGGMKLVKSIISAILSSNPTESTGITGGYKNLVESDVKNAKAYKDGDNTVIEMVMVEQVAGPRESQTEGTVGHAISVVGDIGVVTDQINEIGLPIKISDKDTTIYYTNPVAKVLIDSNGKIIKGTWCYTVEIKLNNYKVGNTTVETTSVVMDNVITVNGGFDK